MQHAVQPYSLKGRSRLTDLHTGISSEGRGLKISKFATREVLLENGAYQLFGSGLNYKRVSKKVVKIMLLFVVSLQTRARVASYCCT